MTLPGTPAGRFRVVAVAEALSWAGLLIGMFFKYVVIEHEIGVQVFGPVHGAIFVAYVAVTLATWGAQKVAPTISSWSTGWVSTPAAASAATTPYSEALWASAFWLTRSPIANTFGLVVRP